MNHSFDIENAKKYGVEIAIIIENLFFWINKNRANNKNFFDGSYWTYNSTKAFQELFPYWTEKQISRILNSMKEKKIIKTGNYNKVAYDRTLWYAFTEEFIKEKEWDLEENADDKKRKSNLPNEEMERTKKENGFPENVKPIPDNNTNNNTNNKQYNKPDKKQQKENPYKEIYDTYISVHEKLKGNKPEIVYSITSKRISTLLKQGITKEQLIHVIKQAQYDDFLVKTTDFQIQAILSDNQVAKLINTRPSYILQKVIPPKPKEYCSCGGEIKYGVCVLCRKENCTI